MLRHWSLFLAPQERGEPTKTGLYDETIFIDHPPVLGAALGGYAQQFPKAALLFPFSTAMIVGVWKEAASAAGIPEAVLYQLRHAGASGDLLAARRTLPAIEGRGRWRTSTSVKRYSKAGQVQRSLSRLSAQHLAFAELALANRDKLLLGTWRPRPDQTPPCSHRLQRLRRDSNICITKARNIGVKAVRPRTATASSTGGRLLAKSRRTVP